MTHEERASVIKKVFWIVMIGGIAAAVWFYPKPAAEAVAVADAGPAVKVSEDALAIVHHHLPGDPASEQVASALNNIQEKYGKQVVIKRVDVRVDPAASRAEGVTKAPHVIISARDQRVFDFQGAWPKQQMERKIDELFHGLKRVGKDWRPAVPGMKPAGS